MDLMDKREQERARQRQEYRKQLFARGREAREKKYAEWNALSPEEKRQEIDRKRQEEREHAEWAQKRKAQVAALVQRDEAGELSVEEYNRLHITIRMMVDHGRFQRSTPQQRTEYLARRAGN